MKWNLRWAAARRDIWRPTQLLAAFQEVGFNPSLSKVAAMWSNQPVTVRLDDLDRICAALHCTVADLMEAEPVAAAERESVEPQAVGESGPLRPVPRPASGGRRRALPPN
ncbi:helix-turn-helix transcriptional regulator [Kitasatospora sp. NPDC002551]|uniref:helix-turn-helix domain-containing protein n=1 Tax=Kitasatospora sp. NPDC002551 TaxID=3154539 RepID=UPI00332A8119